MMLPAAHRHAPHAWSASMMESLPICKVHGCKLQLIKSKPVQVEVVDSHLCWPRKASNSHGQCSMKYTAHPACICNPRGLAKLNFHLLRQRVKTFRCTCLHKCAHSNSRSDQAESPLIRDEAPFRNPYPTLAGQECVHLGHAQDLPSLTLSRGENWC